jgi:hypothetical protein
LVVAASDAKPSAIARKADSLLPELKSGMVVQTADCGEKRNIFAVVTDVASSKEAAQAELVSVKMRVPDAYIKTCDVQPGSLLSLRIPAIDASIGKVPTDAVNWSEEDRVSTVQALEDGRSLAIVRYFAKIPGDPLEGRRERVVLVAPSGKRTVLEDGCSGPSPAVTDTGRIAFSCAREQAGDNIIHSVEVYDTAGRKLKSVDRCRNPKWDPKAALVCDAESFGPGGELVLRRMRVEIK